MTFHEPPKGIDAMPLHRAHATSRLGLRCALVLCAVTAAWLVTFAALSVSRAGAEPHVVEFTTEASTTVAGAHPDVSTTIRLDYDLPSGAPVPPGFRPRSLRLDLPPGLMGNPHAVDLCPRSAVNETGFLTIRDCPGTSQVGTAHAVINTPTTEPLPGGIFAVEHGPDIPARLVVAFQHSVPLVPITIESRTDTDFGLVTITPEINAAEPLFQLDLALWGAPNARERGGLDYGLGPIGTTPIVPPAPAVEQKAFMTNPTVCDAPKVTKLEMTFYTPPFESHRLTSEDPTPTECGAVPFEPSLDLQPTAKRPDSATGLEVDLALPQSDDPGTIGTSHLRRAEVTLPEGTTMNPAAGDGLAGCTDEQFGDGSLEPARCPDASKVGTVEFDVPLLPDKLKGSIYLGEPLSTDPQSDRMFRLFQYAEGFGLVVKIPGYAKADPVTGRLTAVFEDLPQVPFSNFKLTFKGGERGILATPLDCGTHTTTARLTPWSGNPDAVISSSFEVSADGAGAPCGAAPFLPSLAAGMVSSQAGAHSPFSFTLSRQDGEQRFAGLTVTLPPGLLAKVAGVPLCADAQAAAGTCAAETQVGTVSAGAGAGAPLFLPGKAFLTEGYKGGAYGLAIAVPAIAGPFDLGVVVVRQAIFVDPIDAHITLVSDPLPTIWHGIPLRLRSIGVDVDRPAFMLNPTDCSARQIGTTVLSTAGATAQLTHPFQARGCAGLRFAPKLGLRLTGKTQTTDGKHPGLNAVLTQAPGQAGTKSASVALPLSLALDPDNAQALCEFEAGLRVDCPATSIVGSATAVSPVLNRPLTGPVYFVKNVRIGRTGQPIRTLPTLLIPLRGEIALNLRANSSVESNKLVTTFPGVPDAPITRFELKIAGGRHGILVANTNICTASRRAVVQIDGQNGKRADTAPRLRMPCGTTSPALEVAKARWKGRVLRVSGRVGAKATKRVTVSMRCGAKTIRAAAKPRKGRWSAKLRCGAGRKVGRRLSLAYPGDSTYKAGRVQSSTPRRA